MCYTPILEEFQFFLVVPLPFSHIAVHVLPGKTSQLLAESNIDILIWPIKIDILIISESNIDILIISEPNIDILIISDKANILTNCLWFRQFSSSHDQFHWSNPKFVGGFIA